MRHPRQHRGTPDFPADADPDDERGLSQSIRHIYVCFFTITTFCDCLRAAYVYIMRYLNILLQLEPTIICSYCDMLSTVPLGGSVIQFLMVFLLLKAVVKK